MRGATLRQAFQLQKLYISIHAPHAGCDEQNLIADYKYRIFQSTHPMRGATPGVYITGVKIKNFNPRTPCGVRRYITQQTKNAIEFQSTHPMRGATLYQHRDPSEAKISIHAPHAGCDFTQKRHYIDVPRFQSTHPMRGATPARRPARWKSHNFNPRTPCGVRQFTEAS